MNSATTTVTTILAAVGKRRLYGVNVSWQQLPYRNQLMNWLQFSVVSILLIVWISILLIVWISTISSIDIMQFHTLAAVLIVIN